MSNAQPNKKNILVTGANGQLGSEFRALESNFPVFNFLFTDTKELDITGGDAVQQYFVENNITACINCAAYTAVDKAEQEKERARKINAAAVGNLAKACKSQGARFIHISTDYVFNGRSTSPYMPGDATDPVNYYGETKLRGEKEAFKYNPDTLLIRTAWVYSSYRHNFVKTMMRLMKEKERIGVVSDQKGTPTYAADLAAAIMKIITGEKFIPGIYHYTNEGETTWHGFAKEIAGILHTACIVEAVTTDQYPTPAARPAYSVLDKSSIINTYGIQIPEWQESLRRCISKILEK